MLGEKDQINSHKFAERIGFHAIAKLASLVRLFICILLGVVSSSLFLKSMYLFICLFDVTFLLLFLCLFVFLQILHYFFASTHFCSFAFFVLFSWQWCILYLFSHIHFRDCCYEYFIVVAKGFQSVRAGCKVK